MQIRHELFDSVEEFYNYFFLYMRANFSTLFVLVQCVPIIFVYQLSSLAIRFVSIEFAVVFKRRWMVNQIKTALHRLSHSVSSTTKSRCPTSSHEICHSRIIRRHVSRMIWEVCRKYAAFDFIHSHLFFDSHV